MESLPNDVILLIGDHLEDRRDCYNSVLINHRFHTLFSRALFRSAALRNDSHLQSFLKAVVRQPSLACVIRSLDLSSWKSEPSRPVLSAEDIAVLSTWAKAFSHSDDEHIQWRHDLLNGAEEAWIALLLSLVNNIRQLKLAYPRDNKYLDRMFRRAVSPLGPLHERPAFHRLEEVSLSHMPDDGSKGSLTPTQIMPFFQMPSMRTVSADTLIEPRPTPEDDEDIEQETSQDVSSLISEISLNSSNGCQGMAKLLTSCPSLKSFKYQHSDDHALAEGFQPSSFFGSLSGSKATIETLWLDNLGEHFPFTSSGLNQTHDEWFGSLSDFTALKDLRIRLPNLLDVGYTYEPSAPLTEVLPSSIESLYIEWCKENALSMLIQQLRLVLEVRKNRFRDLRRLDIEGFFHDEDEDVEDSGTDGSAEQHERVIKPRVYEMVEPLRDICAEAGVQLFVRDRACLRTMVEA
ncbi:uncharacterized protein BJX67DRAFT_60160 [Aspergillus lucknowensis]|uniref:Leucine-rich repeat domain-containing protein n=1 Tax=Aspergillus lucknowensis TaxID=176173 RepID=A0ABR4LXE4_9EURO